ncbi:MAG: TRAP transporter small permease [Burkholderiaceae bacterium]|nr:TRAP transporter small permease [Burkholderiaceae bacterium]
MTTANGRPHPRKGIFNTLVTVSGLSVGVATFLIGLFVAYDVIARTLFRMTNSWVTEITMYLMGYITFIGAAYALKEGSHVSVDMLVQKLKPRMRQTVATITNICMLVIVTTLTWLSYQFFWDAWSSHEVSDTLLSVSLWIPYLFFFIGMAWLLVVLIVQIYKKSR